MSNGMDTFRVLCIGRGRGVAYASDKSGDEEEEEIDADDEPEVVFTDDCEADYDREGSDDE